MKEILGYNKRAKEKGKEKEREEKERILMDMEGIEGKRLQMIEYEQNRYDKMENNDGDSNSKYNNNNNYNDNNNNNNDNNGFRLGH